MPNAQENGQGNGNQGKSENKADADPVPGKRQLETQYGDGGDLEQDRQSAEQAVKGVGPPSTQIWTQDIGGFRIGESRQESDNGYQGSRKHQQSGGFARKGMGFGRFAGHFFCPLGLGRRFPRLALGRLHGQKRTSLRLSPACRNTGWTRAPAFRNPGSRPEAPCRFWRIPGRHRPERFPSRGWATWCPRSPCRYRLRRRGRRTLPWEWPIRAIPTPPTCAPCLPVWIWVQARPVLRSRPW